MSPPHTGWRCRRDVWHPGIYVDDILLRLAGLRVIPYRTALRRCGSCEHRHGAVIQGIMPLAFRCFAIAARAISIVSSPIRRYSPVHVQASPRACSNASSRPPASSSALLLRTVLPRGQKVVPAAERPACEDYSNLGLRQPLAFAKDIRRSALYG